MSNRVCVTMQDMKNILSRIRKNTNSSKWSERCSCERCGADVSLGSSDVTLIGGVSARLCMPCRRDWDVDDTVTSQMNLMNEWRVSASAFEHAGDATNAVLSFRESNTYMSSLRSYSVLWLSIPPTRETTDGNVEEPVQTEAKTLAPEF